MMTFSPQKHSDGLTMVPTALNTAPAPGSRPPPPPRQGPLSKKERKANKKITKKHPEFELTYDMMLGIRTTVGRTEGSVHGSSARLSQADFNERHKMRFPKTGSSLTPGHQMRNFKFKDYAPEAFRKLRERFGIDPAEYLLRLCSDFPFLEFISNSKSGQFFFYTHDRQYMIKTQTKAESQFLRKILPKYYDYVQKEKHTLLTRYFGMHRVKPHKRKPMYFVIMSSVFYTDKHIHEVYDLKGSTQGRNATEKEKNQPTPVLKDNDFLMRDEHIQIGPKLAPLFMEQLARDAAFLKKLNIMDYSLLVGIHHMDRPVPTPAATALPDEGGAAGTAGSPTSPSKKKAADASPAAAIDDTPVAGGGPVHTDSLRHPRVVDANSVASSGRSSLATVSTGKSSISANTTNSKSKYTPRPPSSPPPDRTHSHPTPRSSGGRAAALRTSKTDKPPLLMKRESEAGTRARDFNSPDAPGTAVGVPGVRISAASTASSLSSVSSHRPEFPSVDSTMSSVSSATTSANTSAASTLRRDHIPPSRSPSPGANGAAGVLDPHSPRSNGSRRVQNMRGGGHGVGGANGGGIGGGRTTPSLADGDGGSSTTTTAFSPSLTGSSQTPLEFEVVDESELPSREHFVPRQSYYGLKRQHRVLSPMQERFQSPDFDEDKHAAELESANSPRRNVSVFTADSGGLRSRLENGRPGTKIYFMGIIDILQQYNTKKALEHAVKGIKYDPSTISAVHPSSYAQRLVDFLTGKVV